MSSSQNWPAAQGMSTNTPCWQTWWAPRLHCSLPSSHSLGPVLIGPVVCGSSVVIGATVGLAGSPVLLSLVAAAPLVELVLVGASLVGATVLVCGLSVVGPALVVWASVAAVEAVPLSPQARERAERAERARRGR
ncbi:hypothetical protein [Nannocystis sp.]|uniref:hypothetical protein n=1 Tax=Nannocystis sp. TaxID=1962667 RepID=UPI0025E02BB9|nr:hypothetical protein [Nannocystis sp.]MBK7828248.1 hypothetical protein [Nannocystis sp.]